MSSTANRVGMAIKLKNAKMPIASVVMFIVAVSGDVYDTFIDHTEEEAKARAEESNKQAWKAAWEAFEAEGKTEVFAEQARLRIQFLEKRLDTQQRSMENLRHTVNQMLMQDRDNRGVPRPVVAKKPSIPKELRAETDPWTDGECEGSDPLCEEESHAGPAQQMAPMPSLGKMWQEKKEQKKNEFKDKWIPEKAH